MKRFKTPLGITGLITFLLIWEIAFRFKLIDPIFISAPSEIIKAVFIMISSGRIYPHFIISMEEFLLGLLFSIILGIGFGLLIGWYRKVYDFFNPILFALYSTPNLALFPLIMIWAGLGIGAKMIIIFLGAFFPILINTTQGVKNLDPALINLARSFGANDLDIFRTIALPATLPFIVTGLRLAVPKALLSTIAAEFFISSQGLGYLIMSYGSTFQTTKLLAVILIVVTISITFAEILTRIEKRVQSWKPLKD